MLMVDKIYSKLDYFISQNKSIFLTSSFQTQSLVLLKIISDYDTTIPIYFLNTGYHFPETIQYKKELTKLLKLNIIDVYSDTTLLQQFDSNDRLMYTSDTDRCCEMNKTLPLQKILIKHDVWVTGIRRDQTENRKQTEKIEKLEFRTIKYNPILDWTNAEVQNYIEYHKLPKHPLDKNGLISIGCEPCTRLVNAEIRMKNRWFGQTKTECGLHINFKEKV